MICEQRDPAGWIPYCGQEFTPYDWALCPHPRRSGPPPTPHQHHQAAWSAGWRPPNAADTPVTLTTLINAAAAYLGRSVEELRSPSRKAPLVRDRQAVMYACRELAEASYPEIGRALDRDHSTVMASVFRATVDPATATTATDLVNALRSTRP